MAAAQDAIQVERNERKFAEMLSKYREEQGKGKRLMHEVDRLAYRWACWGGMGVWVRAWVFEFGFKGQTWRGKGVGSAGVTVCTRVKRMPSFKPFLGG